MARSGSYHHLCRRGTVASRYACRPVAHLPPIHIAATIRRRHVKGGLPGKMPADWKGDTRPKGTLPKVLGHRIASSPRLPVRVEEELGYTPKNTRNTPFTGLIRRISAATLTLSKGRSSLRHRAKYEPHNKPKPARAEATDDIPASADGQSPLRRPRHGPRHGPAFENRPSWEALERRHSRAEETADR